VESVTSLAPEFLRATEAAAIAAGSMRGCGDNKAADAVAVAAMRAVFDTIAFDGRVAIGEGERDEAPMLWIGEPRLAAGRPWCDCSRYRNRPA